MSAKYCINVGPGLNDFGAMVILQLAHAHNRHGHIYASQAPLAHLFTNKAHFTRDESTIAALSAGRSPFTPRKIPGTHFCQRLSRLQGHSTAGWIRPIDKSNELIGNRTRDLPTCSIVSQPTTWAQGNTE
jgi:hypothetical protein